MIEIFTRQPPFPDLAPVDVALGIVSGNISPTIPPYTPADFIPILQNCFSRKVHERPTAGALVNHFLVARF